MIMAKLKIEHNVDPIQLEEALEKALKGLRRYVEEPDRALPDAIADQLREESNALFDKIIETMLKEMAQVIKGNGAEG